MVTDLCSPFAPHRRRLMTYSKEKLIEDNGEAKAELAPGGVAVKAIRGRAVRVSLFLTFIGLLRNLPV